MSRKTQNTATKKEAKPALVPKLRFPEFRGIEAWKSEPMGEVYSFKGNNSLSRDKLNYVAGSVKNIHSSRNWGCLPCPEHASPGGIRSMQALKHRPCRGRRERHLPPVLRRIGVRFAVMATMAGCVKRRSAVMA